MIRQLSAVALLAIAGVFAAPAMAAQCATTVESNDAMKFNTASLSVPASCKEYKVTLKHVGQLPVAVMGHNIVVSKTADMAGVAADGIGAGAAAGYVKAGDARVVAASDLIGGGQTTTFSIPVSKLVAGQAYSFFCSFPGHSSLMKGTLTLAN